MDAASGRSNNGCDYSSKVYNVLDRTMGQNQAVGQVPRMTPKTMFRLGVLGVLCETVSR